MCGGQQSGKAPRRSRRANGIVAPWSVAAAPKTPSKNSRRASSPSSIPPGGSTGPGTRLSTERAAQSRAGAAPLKAMCRGIGQETIPEARVSTRVLTCIGAATR